MIHTISGNNFHGDYGFTLRGSAAGFLLSPTQVKKWQTTLCNYTGCQCGGGYGAGLDDGSASIEQEDWDTYRLVPSGEKNDYQI